MQDRLKSLFAGVCLLVCLPVAVHAQGASFPKSIPNLLARWEPSQAGGAYADTAKTKAATMDGTSVAVIADLSGNGYDMVQAAGSDQGLYKTAGSFKPGCVRFNGASSTYSAGAPAAFNLISTSAEGYTVFLIYEETTGQQSYGSILSKQSTGGGPFSFLTLNIGTQFARYNTSISAGAFTPPDAFTLNSPSFVTYRYAPILNNSVPGAPPAVFGEEKIWKNGVVDDDVTQQNDPWQYSSNVRLGTDDAGQFPVHGDIAAVVVYARALQTNEIGAVENYLSQRYGVSLSSTRPGTPPSASIFLHATGNSIMAGLQTDGDSAFKQGIANLAWQPYAAYNEAIGGQQTSQMTVAAPEREDRFLPADEVNALFAWEGKNEITSGATGQEAYEDMTAYLADRRAAGFAPIFAMTLLPCGTGGSTFEAQRQACNALMKSDFTTPVSGYPGLYAANPGVTYADYLIDIGSDATIGAPNAYSNMTYYASDHTHLNPYGAGYAAKNYFTPAFNLVYDQYFGGIVTK